MLYIRGKLQKWHSLFVLVSAWWSCLSRSVVDVMIKFCCTAASFTCQGIRHFCMMQAPACMQHVQLFLFKQTYCTIVMTPKGWNKSWFNFWVVYYAQTKKSTTNFLHEYCQHQLCGFVCSLESKSSSVPSCFIGHCFIVELYNRNDAPEIGRHFLGLVWIEEGDSREVKGCRSCLIIDLW